MHIGGGKGDGKGEVKRTALGVSHAVLTSFWLALNWAGWVIVLSGLSALQHKCHNSSASISDPDEWDPANFPVPGGGPPKGPTSALFPDLSCGKIYRFYWFITFLEFTTLVLVSYILLMGAVRQARGFLIGLLATTTVLTMIATDRFLNLFSVAHGNNVNNRARVTFAGFLIVSTLNYFLIYMLGIDVEESPINR